MSNITKKIGLLFYFVLGTSVSKVQFSLDIIGGYDKMKNKSYDAKGES